MVRAILKELMKLTFWGAARTVTGSMHELTHEGERYLLDCGLYQGHREEARKRNEDLPVRARSVRAVMLSHAHTDHTGNLPTLVKHGFEGDILANSATIDLCGAMLPDSGNLQERDAEFVNKKLERRRKSEMVEPLYTLEDAQKTLQFLKAVPQNKTYEVADGLTCKRYDAGHMLGSTAMMIEARNGGKRVKLLFSGDVGRVNLPIIRDPEAVEPADYLIMESTYGDRLHAPTGPVMDKLADVVRRTCERGGKIVVPAFAVGRTQQMVLLLHQLTLEGRLPNIPIFVDSPLAVNVTEVFRRHPECFDDETNRFLLDGDDPFGFNRLRYVREAADSKKLNDLRGPMMVISASGMMEAGRVLHHLRNTIEDPRNTVLITGYQAEHTLGRKIQDKMSAVPIFGELHRLRAEVVQMKELSGHADQRELVEWMRPVVPGLKGVFLVHGEEPGMSALQAVIEETYKVPVHIPSRGDSFDLV
jgi:metallo-beta-lactamase family protein